MKMENNIEEKIKESLGYLDDSVKFNTPGMGRFRMMVEQVEQKKRAKADRQFLVFLFTAIAAICIETFAFSRSLLTFIAVQAAAVILLPAMAALVSRLLPGQVKLD